MEKDSKNLEQYWWHRLIKTLFIILGVVFAGIIFLFFYGTEEGNATSYMIVKTFSQYLSDQAVVESQKKLDCLASTIPNFLCHSTPIAPANFIDEYDLNSYPLGCLRTDKVVEYLDPYVFKNSVTCDKQTGLVCQVPQNICSGDSSNIVKYHTTVIYGFKNYYIIFLKTLLALVFLFFLARVAYYKGLIYVIFGKRE